MKHYLVTPWNVDNLDPEWLERRHQLFERVCLPSVQSQTNKNFEWVLVVDSRTPESFKRRLEAYPAEILYHDFGEVNWKHPKPRHKAYRAINLEYAIAQPLREYIGTPDVDYVITSRLDSDDAISVNHIAKIQTIIIDEWDEGERYWVNLVRGLKLCGDHVYPINRQSNPFISFVEPPHQILTAYQVCHVEANQTPYPIRQVREGQPTWMQHIHKGNLLNRLVRFRGKKPLSTVTEYFKVKGPGS